MSVCNFLGFITSKAPSKAAATWGLFLDLIGIAKANLLNMSREICQEKSKEMFISLQSRVIN